MRRRRWAVTAWAVLTTIGGCVPPVLEHDDGSTAGPPLPMPDAIASAVCTAEACCKTWFGGYDADACIFRVGEDYRALEDRARLSGAMVVPDEVAKLVGLWKTAAKACVLDESASAQMAVTTQRLMNGWKAPGDACEEDIECADPPDGWGGCVREQRARDACQVVGTCRNIRMGGFEGDACHPSVGAGEILAISTSSCSEGDPVPDLRFCNGAPGLGCRSTSNRCVVRGTTGAPCAGQGECADGWYCDFMKSPFRCAPRRGTGETCQSVDSCAAGSRCDLQMICVATQEDGEACLADTWCGPESRCVHGHCLPARVAVSREWCGAP
jgi:hypothetical protein